MPWVAPPAGAWIETRNPCAATPRMKVAPPAGAWIETNLMLRLVGLSSSRPPRARGLKHNAQFFYKKSACVAPPAGAWIETLVAYSAILVYKSRPPRARGLKLRDGKEL